MKTEQGEAEEEREWEEGRGRVRKREHCFLLVTLCFWHRLALKTASSIGIVAFFFCPFFPFFAPFFCHFSTSLVYAIALRVSCTFAAFSDAHLKVCNATNENEHKQKKERGRERERENRKGNFKNIKKQSKRTFKSNDNKRQREREREGGNKRKKGRTSAGVHDKASSDEKGRAGGGGCWI